MDSFPIERAYGQITGFGSFFKGHFLISPCFVNLIEVIWKWSWWPAKLHATGFCRCNALRLPLPDVGALVFSHKGEHLQHDVAQKSSHQVFATPSIQQRHIQHYNVCALCLGEQPPLL